MLTVPKWLADTGLRLNRLYYKQLREKVYGARHHPSWFDHRIDLYYHWPHHLFWMERGVLPRRLMTEGCTVLDLFCGDGFFSRHFYSTIAGRIDAIDKDPRAIEHARRWYSHPNVHYRVVDAVRENFPSPSYDVIVWFEGMDHISADEYRHVVERIKAAIRDGGALTGSIGLVPEETQGKVHWEHQNEFARADDLRDFLSRDFRTVQIDETVHPDLAFGKRRIGYFTVGDPK